MSHFSLWVLLLLLRLQSLLLLHPQRRPTLNTPFPLLPLINLRFSLPTLHLLRLLLRLLLLPSPPISHLSYSRTHPNLNPLPGNCSELPLVLSSVLFLSLAFLLLFTVGGGGSSTLRTRRLSDPIVVSGCSLPMLNLVMEVER